MNFISIPFVILLIVLILLFIIEKSRNNRKIILLIASCVFYAYWDWRCFLLLSAFTAITYYVSLCIVTTPNAKTRHLWLVSGIVINLVFLGFFKYFNFFIDSINVLFTASQWRLHTLNLIVPLGISFFTFGNLSYLFDIARGTSKPAKSWLDYALFIGFFPRVVSGPIVRAAQFLPQLESGINFNFSNIFEGIQIFLRGCLKKLVIADSLALMTNFVFSSPSVFSPLSVWTSVLAYSVQIYFDFSGYTDMAIGISKILGIDLPQNFNLPYTSLSVTEFWRRWHMTLSAWFRDYVFYPLERNRSRRSLPQIFQYLNTLLVFLLTGLWHGASWNFVLWGGLFGIYLVIERIFNIGKVANGKWTTPVYWLRALFTFLLVSITWVFFRSPSFEITIQIFQKLLFLNQSGLDWMYSPAVWAIPIVVISGFVLRQIDFHVPVLETRKSYTWAVLLVEILIIFFFVSTEANPFIYFQF
jgi:alginate O-acetyltransferase complex protein AlgI